MVQFAPLVPSAYCWKSQTESPAKAYYASIVAQAVRASDPFLTVNEGWVVRRIAPDCSRIEFADLPQEHSEEKLLRAMGTETANIHFGSGSKIEVIRSVMLRSAVGDEASRRRVLRLLREQMLAMMVSTVTCREIGTQISLIKTDFYRRNLRNSASEN